MAWLLYRHHRTRLWVPPTTRGGSRNQLAHSLRCGRNRKPDHSKAARCHPGPRPGMANALHMRMRVACRAERPLPEGSPRNCGWAAGRLCIWSRCPDCEMHMRMNSNNTKRPMASAGGAGHCHCAAGAPRRIGSAAMRHAGDGATPLIQPAFRRHGACPWAQMSRPGGAFRVARTPCQNQYFTSSTLDSQPALTSILPSRADDLLPIYYSHLLLIYGVLEPSQLVLSHHATGSPEIVWLPINDRYSSRTKAKHVPLARFMYLMITPGPADHHRPLMGSVPVPPLLSVQLGIRLETG